jgi:uncharacterized protein YgbK (DUF1537 family)
MTIAHQLILADDLTGACDAAAPFAMEGGSVCVRWGESAFASSDCETFAVCMGTRSLRSGDAERAAFRFARQARELGFQRVLQKMDSTLKGNYAAEMAGVLHDHGYQAAIVAPALPEMGRQIVGGRLLLAGNDTLAMPSLLEAIERRCALPVHAIDAQQLRHGGAALATFVASWPDKPRIYVVDGETDGDLDVVAEAIALLDSQVLAVGSSGLAARIARQRGADRVTVSVDREPNATGARSLVFFIGSDNPCTTTQAEALVAARLARRLDESRDVDMQIGVNAEAGVYSIVPIGWGPEQSALIDAVLRASIPERVAGFVLTGGDTAQLVCDRAAAEGIKIQGEITRGIPWGRLMGGVFDGTSVATKAGGFGGDDALVRVGEFLLQRTPTTAR